MHITLTFKIREMMDLKRGIDSRINEIEKELLPKALTNKVEDLYYEEIERLKNLKKRLGYL